MNYLDLPQNASHVKIYDLFPSEKHFQEFLEFANKVVCSKMYLDPKQHSITINTSITVWPDFESPFVKEEKKK